MFGKKQKYIVHKFGGSSLLSAKSYQAVKTRLKGTDEIIIVSALHGITSKLQLLLDLAESQQPIDPLLEEIKAQHVVLISELLAEAEAFNLISTLETDFTELNDLLKSVQIARGYSKEIAAIVLSYGELWSAKVLSTILGEGAQFLDAREVLHTFIKRGQLEIDWSRSQTALEESLKKCKFDQLVIPGFIASDETGHAMILGRNGSDFSASIFAKLFHAQALFIWKDVDGVFSADPTRVPQAFAVPKLSYESAMELAYFGAKVIHPKTIAPAMELNIPIHIKNTLHPERDGTLISTHTESSDRPVQGLTSIDQVALITIAGAGLIGVSGTAERVFASLSHNAISVILISQASSEHSICFAVKLTQSDKALHVLQEAFEFEIEQGLVTQISANNECAILAAVGDGMVGAIGVLGHLTSTLASANVNIIAVAQGSSERNISIVVRANDIDKALRAVHAGFYLSKKTLSIGIIGPGLVGSTLIEQINQELMRLKTIHQVNLQVRGICNSKKMLLDKAAIDLSNWSEALASSNSSTNLSDFISHVVSDDMPHAVIIDCSASQHIADFYFECVEKGAHVITPNKRMNSGVFSEYSRFKSLVDQKSRHYLYETTVCAGLPVITSMHDIIQTGDEVIEVQGIVSGTLSYIFNRLSEGKPFSEIILQAKEGGYTEPDPRDDLTGMDVARKVVILARELGFEAELDHVNVVNLVPEKLRKVSVEKFLAELPNYDDEITAQIDENTKPGEVPVYLGVISQAGTIDVGIKSFPQSHPFSRLSGTDNMLIFKTKRYYEQPLVIQGPGAGADVTAAGVFADLLRLVSFI